MCRCKAWQSCRGTFATRGNLPASPSHGSRNGSSQQIKGATQGLGKHGSCDTTHMAHRSTPFEAASQQRVAHVHARTHFDDMTVMHAAVHQHQPPHSASSNLTASSALQSNPALSSTGTLAYEVTAVRQMSDRLAAVHEATERPLPDAHLAELSALVTAVVERMRNLSAENNQLRTQLAGANGRLRAAVQSTDKGAAGDHAQPADDSISADVQRAAMLMRRAPTTAGPITGSTTPARGTGPSHSAGQPSHSTESTAAMMSADVAAAASAPQLTEPMSASRPAAMEDSGGIGQATGSTEARLCSQPIAVPNSAEAQRDGRSSTEPRPTSQPVSGEDSARRSSSDNSATSGHEAALRQHATTLPSVAECAVSEGSEAKFADVAAPDAPACPDAACDSNAPGQDATQQ